MKTQSDRAGFKLACRLFGSLFLYCGMVFSQSASQNFPTPIRSNEISGVIQARDIGDARLTTHYYTFTGNQGDIFINVVTKNLDGDIDVFTADTLKPLTKIVVYSDASDNETGRVVYLRQSQKLILRVEGRTPNDQPASYRLKFAGSFEPSAEVAASDDIKEPEVTTKRESDITVNSVGTIISVKPKPTPKPIERETVAPIAKKPAEKTADRETTPTPVEPEPAMTVDREDTKKVPEKVAQTESRSKPEVVVTDELPKKDAPAKKTKTSPVSKTRQPVPAKTASRPVVVPKTPNPLEAINLVVLFKDGTKIERPMSEILKVSVDKGILTIVHKDGSIGRYSILEVAKMTIE